MGENNLTDETIETFHAQLDKIYESTEELGIILRELSGEVVIIRKILKKALLD